MQILRLPENIVYQAIKNFHIPWTTTALTALDATFKYRERASPFLAQNLRRIQLFFLNPNNTAALIGDISEVRKVGGDRLAIATALISGISAVLYYAQKRFHQELAPASCKDTIPETHKKSIQLTLETPQSQTYAEVVYLIRIVVNVVMVYFSSDHLLLRGLNIMGSGYSLLKTRQLKWLTFTRVFQYTHEEQEENVFSPENCNPKEGHFKYHLPLFPYRNSCSVCLEENDSLVSFCPPHAPLDYTCLVKHIFIASDNFTKAKFLFSREINNRRISYYAHIEMPQSDLPKCPECKTYPANHFLEAQYIDWDKKKGNFITTLKIIPDSNVTPSRPFISATLWARLNVVSSVLQAGFAVMQQRHPELAEKILFGQKIFSVINLGALVENYIQLHKALYKRYVVEKLAQNMPETNVKKATESFESANLKQFRLGNAIQTDIETGNSIKVYKNFIPLTEQGNQVIQKVKDGVNKQTITFSEENSLRILSPEGMQIYQELLNARANGEIISILDFIPLCPEGISLIKQFKMYIKNKDIIIDIEDNKYKAVTPIGQQLLILLESAQNNYHVTSVPYLDINFLPLSDNGMDRLRKLHNAIQYQAIKKNQGQLTPVTKEGEEILKQFQNALNNLEIISVQENTSIPLTLNARENLKKHSKALAELGEAANALEGAKKEEKAIQFSLEKKYHEDLLRAMTITVIILPVISAFITTMLNKQLRPAVDLTEILKTIALPDDYKNMKVSWNLPWLQYASHCLIASKIAINLALAVFSSERRTFALSALLQSFTLWKLSQLPWIKLERAFFGFHFLKNVNASFEILLPSFQPLKGGCPSLSSHFEAHFKSIYDYTSKFFEKSIWNRYWVSTMMNGVEISRKLNYNVVLKPSSLATCGCKTAAILERLIGSATDITYGLAQLNFQWPAGSSVAS